MERKDIFISYKSEDSAQAQWLCSVLEANGLSCWMAPESIPGGSNYAKEIPQAIEHCRIFILVLTQRCQNSIWVPKELDRALNAGKIIMPFMLENCLLTDDFNFYLSNVQRYDAYRNKADALERMLKDIRALLGTENDGIRKPPVWQAAPPKAKNVKKPALIAVIALCLVAVLVLGIRAMRPDKETKVPELPQQANTTVEKVSAATEKIGQNEETEETGLVEETESVMQLKAEDVAALEEQAKKLINGRGTGYPQIQTNDGDVLDVSADKLANCMTAFSFLEKGYLYKDTPLFDEVTTWVLPFSLSLEDVPYHWVDNKYYDEAQLFDYPALYGYFTFTDLVFDEDGNVRKEGSFGIEMSSLYENRDTMEVELASRHRTGELSEVPLN